MHLKSWILILTVAVGLYSSVYVIASKATVLPTPEVNFTQSKGMVSHQSETDLSLHPAAPVPARGAVPYFIEPGAVSASLEALQKNGADLSKPMHSTHKVFCETPEAAQQISDWAVSAGFQTKAPQKMYLEAGNCHFMVDLVKNEIPRASTIQEQGRMVAETSARISGVAYFNWNGAAAR